MSSPGRARTAFEIVESGVASWFRNRAVERLRSSGIGYFEAVDAISSPTHQPLRWHWQGQWHPRVVAEVDATEL